MIKNYPKIVLMILGLWFYLTAAAFAAASDIQNIRSGQSAAKVRIVLDVSTLPEYKPVFAADKTDGGGQLVVELPGAVNKSAVRELSFNDPVVRTCQIDEAAPGKLRVLINVKAAMDYKVFSLSAPNRLVIDIIKQADQKNEREVAPGLKYTEWLRYTASGPVFAYILDADVKAGLKIKPVLSNDQVPGLERLSAMSDRNNAVAAVNGSYFALNGETIGTLKLDGQIAGIPELPRTAFGILPSGNVILGQADYHGTVMLPSGKKVEISGVDSERGTDGLILYNRFYGERTGTNEYGLEYVIMNNKVAAINQGNSVIPAEGAVLSAHGAAKDALAGLKVGDSIVINQTIGGDLDRATDVLGAGPMLLKNGSLFVTAKLEEFPADISVGRAPRTALGVTKDGHILLVVVDGRQPEHSIGMTLTELAGFMKELGAIQAMNLDGGGSSEMTVGDDVVNQPSDGRERAVGTAIVVQQK
jgi:exopolysaccharide biosynthesis protein